MKSIFVYFCAHLPPTAVSSFGTCRPETISCGQYPPVTGQRPETFWGNRSCGLEIGKSTRLNSSHLGISYAVLRYLLSFPTRRSSDLTCRPETISCGQYPPVTGQRPETFWGNRSCGLAAPMSEVSFLNRMRYRRWIWRALW